MAKDSELTFVYQFSGETPKRRRLAKACDSCRARKKRCMHFAGAGKDAMEEDGDQDENGHDSKLDDSGYEITPSSAATSKKFFSDMNPESALLNRTASRGGVVPKPNEDLGVWVDRREWDALIKQKNDAEAAMEHNAVLEDQKPHPDVLKPLVDLYFSKIQPLLPVVEEAEFRERFAAGKAVEPLVHAMCLVIAKHTDAEPFLKLTGSTAPLPPREFCKRLHQSVKSVTSTLHRCDRITQIRTLALFSMHSEGADGCEEASMYLTQAMHHAQSLGLHLGQHQGQRDLAVKRLFWCLWVLDRTNSAMHGRPLIMSDIDIAIEPFASGESGYPAFEAHFHIIDVLNKVINFYRPHNPIDTTGWEDQFPGLEEIFDNVGAWQLPESIIATLHMVYLAVAILSHRCRGIKQIPRGTHSSIRQRLCASEVIRFMESASQRASLHPLPCIPYAVGLSLSVQYQHLRQSQITHQQQDAHVNFRAATLILQALRPTWSSADTMATLARKVLDELDRAPNLLAFRVPRDANRAAVVDDEHAIGPPTACHGITDIPTSDRTANGTVMVDPDSGALAIAQLPSKQSGVSLDGLDLFDGMDDVFGTYLDPNYPVNLEDFSFADEAGPNGGTPFAWAQMAGTTRG